MGREWREPKRSESPGEHGPYPELTLRGAAKGCGFLRGSKPLERQYEALAGFVRKRKSGKRDSKESLDHEEGGKL
jgi:hypothetical protein